MKRKEAMRRLAEELATAGVDSYQFRHVLHEVMEFVQFAIRTFVENDIERPQEPDSPVAKLEFALQILTVAAGVQDPEDLPHGDQDVPWEEALPGYGGGDDGGPGPDDTIH